ncbi:MAG TPA: lysylphosphatidylglycerol synthase transmembrane domain-containing protein [Miltoncostaeaceae bacterium]|nr:lysylphosphatidylglycerol synthase transmembrane domain-containing protein [Miltoncostaeaceae bacterium]
MTDPPAPAAGGAAPRTRRAAAWLGPVVSVVALAAVVAWALRQPRPELPDGRAGLAWCALALALYAGATALRAARWRAVVVHDGIALGRRAALGLTLIGYMGNNTLPARAGDLMRVGMLARRSDAGLSRALGTVVAERLLDALALALLLAAAAALVLPAAGGLPVGALVTAGALVLAAATALAVLVRRARRGGAGAGLVRRLAPVVRATGRLRGRHGAAMLALSLAIWLLEAAVFLAVARAAGVPLGVAGAVYTMAFTNLVGLVPAGPGYVGTFDAAVILAARAAGGGGGAVVAFALLLRVVLFVPITLAGLAVLLARHGRRPGRRTAPAAGAPRADTAG